MERRSIDVTRAIRGKCVSGMCGFGSYRRIDGTRMKIRQSAAVTTVKRAKTIKLLRFRSFWTAN
jgi:hypothetical protein